jgi:hypothetical protein
VPEPLERRFADNCERRGFEHVLHLGTRERRADDDPTAFVDDQLWGASDSAPPDAPDAGIDVQIVSVGTSASAGGTGPGGRRAAAGLGADDGDVELRRS